MQQTEATLGSPEPKRSGEKRKKSAEEKAAKKAKKQEAGERAHQKIVAQLEHVPAAEALKADADKAALEMRKAELLQTVSSSVAADAGRAVSSSRGDLS